MASLECSNCHYGIHYHDIPDGTESILFSIREWERLVNTDLLTCDYTFDSSTSYIETWKCEKCGAIMLFSNGSQNVISSYKRSDIIIDLSHFDGALFIVFEDIAWDTITEPEITGSKISDVFPDVKYRYAKISDDYIVYYDDKTLEKAVAIFERIKA